MNQTESNKGRLHACGQGKTGWQECGLVEAVLFPGAQDSIMSSFLDMTGIPGVHVFPGSYENPPTCSLCSNWGLINRSSTWEDHSLHCSGNYLFNMQPGLGRGCCGAMRRGRAGEPWPGRLRRFRPSPPPSAYPSRAISTCPV